MRKPMRTPYFYLACLLFGTFVILAVPPAAAADPPGKLEDPAAFIQRNIAAYQAALAALKQKYEDLGCGELPKPPEAQKPPPPPGGGQPPPGPGQFPPGLGGGFVPGAPGGDYKIELWRVVNQGGNNPFMPRDPVNNSDGKLVSSSQNQGGGSSGGGSSYYQLGLDNSVSYDVLTRHFGHNPAPNVYFGQFYWYVDSSGNILAGPVAPAGWGLPAAGHPPSGTMPITASPGMPASVIISLDGSQTGSRYLISFTVSNSFIVSINSVTQLLGR